MVSTPTAIIFSLVQRDLASVEQTLARSAEADDALLRRMLGLVLPGGGKRLRPALALLCGRVSRYDPERLISFAVSLEMLHTATLVHDDIVDEASVRRGQPTLNMRVTTPVAVLVGDYMFAQSAAHAAATRQLSVMNLFAQAAMAIISGQIGEAWADGGLGLTKDQYFRRIGAKTATLFALAAEGGATLSDAPEEVVAALRLYGYKMGLAFQVVDDILDVVGDERILGKPVGSDMRQGTVTLPAILVRDQVPETMFRSAFLGDGHRNEPIGLLLEAIRAGGSIDRCYLEAERLAAEACAALEAVPAGEVRDALLDLADFVVRRVV